jgi:hypothetical protein
VVDGLVDQQRDMFVAQRVDPDRYVPTGHAMPEEGLEPPTRGL